MRTMVWRKRLMEDILSAGRLPGSAASFRAMTDGGELLRQAAAEGGNECEEAQRHIAQRAKSRRNGGQSGEADGKGNHMHRLGTAADHVLVELVLAALPKRDRECISERYCITEAQVHSLPTRGAVRMRGGAGKQYPSGPVPVRHPLVHPKPGSPDDVSDPDRGATRSPGVEQSLSEGGVWPLRRIVDFGQ